MKQITQEQITRIFDDIELVRKAIQKNTLLLQQIGLTKSLQLTALFSGTMIIFFSFLSIFLKNHYGSFAQAPVPVRVGFITASLISLVVSAILKSSGISKEARSISPDITFWKIASELYTQRIAHFNVAIIVLIVAASAISIFRDNAELIISILSIGIALELLVYHVLFRITVFMIVGYWNLITGLILLVTPDISTESGLILSIGAGMLLLGTLPSIIRERTTLFRE